MQNIGFYVVGFIAVCCYAFLIVISKKVQNTIPPFAFIALTMFVLMTLALMASLLFERSFSLTSLDKSTIIWIVLFGVINLASFALYLKAITGIPVAHYQLIGTIGPVVAATIAFFMLGEQVGARFFMAIPIVFLGLYIALIR